MDEELLDDPPNPSPVVVESPDDSSNPPDVVVAVELPSDLPGPPDPLT